MAPRKNTPKVTPPTPVAHDTVTKGAYDKLLAAFEALIIRENLDIQLQRKYRTEAGLL